MRVRVYAHNLSLPREGGERSPCDPWSLPASLRTRYPRWAVSAGVASSVATTAGAFKKWNVWRHNIQSRTLAERTE